MKDKSKMQRSLKSNMSIKECNKLKKDWEKFGYSITNSYIEALLLDKKNVNILLYGEIDKEMTSL